jgi:hypothetical protein
MNRFLLGWLLGLGAAITNVHAETLLLKAAAGHEARLRVPVGAIAGLSANVAESFTDGGEAGYESMHLSGGVMIGIHGSTQPILIEADSLVLELTADADLRSDAGLGTSMAQSDKTMAGSDGSQIFIGDVVFDVPTSAGLMQIKADRVERR